MSKTTILEPPGPIEPVQLKDALEERYLAYALSTIMHRALPDVRDGLKPVHRRILFAMRGLGLDPDGGYRKCAKIVGETMGNFHPHGNQAIYDALARLAQDFAVRYPLVDGQGNFGNIDGDNPAADRYTEARLTEVAAQLLALAGKQVIWYYGHEHVGAVYKPQRAGNVTILPRCCGHACIPWGTPSDLQGSSQVLWFEDEVLGPGSNYFVTNGFATLTLDGSSIQETFFNQSGQAHWNS